MTDTQSPYGPDDADPYADDDTVNPHDTTGPADEADDEAPAPAKRGPGRPRKNST